MTKRKTIRFAKVDWYGTGRKANLPEVEIELRDTPKGPELSICGRVWNARRTDCATAGQCLDSMAEKVKSPKFKEIHRLWKLYHLNGMHAGDKAQESFLKALFEGRSFDYDMAVAGLKAAGLYEHDGYKYGHGWIYERIPEEDMAKIEALLAE